MMRDHSNGQKDAYDLILEAIDSHVYTPGDRLVESELAERFGVSRTPVREALQRLETQSLLTRDGRSLIVASLITRSFQSFMSFAVNLKGWRHVLRHVMRHRRKLGYCATCWSQTKRCGMTLKA